MENHRFARWENQISLLLRTTSSSTRCSVRIALHSWLLQSQKSKQIINEIFVGDQTWEESLLASPDQLEDFMSARICDTRLFSSTNCLIYSVTKLDMSSEVSNVQVTPWQPRKIQICNTHYIAAYLELSRYLNKGSILCPAHWPWIIFQGAQKLAC